jgi:hypothetical protein
MTRNVMAAMMKSRIVVRDNVFSGSDDDTTLTGWNEASYLVLPILPRYNQHGQSASRAVLCGTG